MSLTDAFNLSLECSNAIKNVTIIKNESKKYKQSFEQKFHQTKFARSMLKNDDVIKNGCGLPKKCPGWYAPKLILRKVIKFQKGLMKNKKIDTQKIEKADDPSFHRAR